ncbi:MAG: hypothetical protein C4293_22315, partial [Nitrospiraceae bacterium]
MTSFTMNLPVRWKVTLNTLLAVTLGLAVAGWLSLRSLERLELARLTETLTAHTGLAARALQPLMPYTDQPPDELQKLAGDLSRHALARVTIIAPDGVVLADSETPDDAVPRMDNHGSRPEVAQALATGRGIDIRVSQTTGKRMLYLALPVVSSDRATIGIVR